MHDDTLIELEIYKAFLAVIPDYDPYGETEVNQSQWKAILDYASQLNTEAIIALTEATPWVNEALENEKVKVKPMEKSIEDLEAKKMQNFEKYKLGKMNRQKFIDSKNLIDEEIQAIKEKIQKEKEEKEVIDNTKLTGELMKKYIDSVFCEGNEVLNIIWK